MDFLFKLVFRYSFAPDDRLTDGRKEPTTAFPRPKAPFGTDLQAFSQVTVPADFFADSGARRSRRYVPYRW